ncbi:MAG: PIN domain-containing protein [Gemmatimonadales bacterium]
MTVIADTGPIYALIDSSDSWHDRVLTWWRANREHIVVPVCVLPEVCYLLQSRISMDAEAAFVHAVANGEFTVEPLETEDIERADSLLRKYRELGIGFVDATVIATAERLDATEILTTDRRHFSAVRPRHAGRLRLSP